MTKDTGSEIDEILGNYGIVRISKKPPFGIVHIESDTLFEHLEALIDKRDIDARINELEQAHNSGYLKGVSDTNQAFVKASLHKEQTASSQTGDEDGTIS